MLDQDHLKLIAAALAGLPPDTEIVAAILAFEDAAVLCSIAMEHGYDLDAAKGQLQHVIETETPHPLMQS